MTDCQFILASQSPRRADLLGRYGLRFAVRPADIDESRRPAESPDDFVLRLAREKAAAVEGAGLPVLGADTVVVLEQDVLGKPRDRDDALDMLSRLSGRAHEVLTAVCVRNAQRSETLLSRTEVQFATLSSAQIQAYWNSGESAGKAGAYAIQGLAEAFVTEIRGSYSGVVGLPLQGSLGLLKLFGVEPPVWSVHE
ncbi:maf protein [Oceanococcus atlanticus]|uniref:dTTP/UTP pyrophosphatase n=1 Tax=Oceanococcus atlanticus TaxID=1317117 RepID=A0A1Y1SA63_9GAMM|nr:Maf family protein [Oceanococcus atlanticus]ORE85217.1 maf protein [Oceanococcus atlanticus]